MKTFLTIYMITILLQGYSQKIQLQNIDDNKRVICILKSLSRTLDSLDRDDFNMVRIWNKNDSILFENDEIHSKTIVESPNKSKAIFTIQAYIPIDSTIRWDDIYTIVIRVDKNGDYQISEISVNELIFPSNEFVKQTLETRTNYLNDSIYTTHDQYVITTEAYEDLSNLAGCLFVCSISGNRECLKFFKQFGNDFYTLNFGEGGQYYYTLLKVLEQKEKNTAPNNG